MPDVVSQLERLLLDAELAMQAILPGVKPLNEECESTAERPPERISPRLPRSAARKRRLGV